MANVIPARFPRPAPLISHQGRVAIVGAGPGDPELLTVKACRFLEAADVVVYDRLVSEAVLDLARAGARRIYVGKASGNHSLDQDEINALLALEARAGRRVVRLKGGDPFVFGRGGEELEYLMDRGIEVEVVPGITAASACAASTGIPLTHRDMASSVTFVSGHCKEGGPELDWRSLAECRHTLVVYMGVANAATIASRLIHYGRAEGTPVAVVERGSLPEERCLTGTLADLGELVSRNHVGSPALIIIGEVARLAKPHAAHRAAPRADVAFG